MNRSYIVLDCLLLISFVSCNTVDTGHSSSNESGATSVRERRSANDWTDIIKPVAQIMLPLRELAAFGTNTLEAASIIGKVTLAASGYRSPRQIAQPVKDAIGRSQRSMSHHIDQQQALLRAEAEWLRDRVTTHRDNLEQRLDYVRRQGQHISTRVTDLHGAVDQGFAVTQRELRKVALKMSKQVDKFHKHSKRALKDVKGSLDELHSNVALVDNGVGQLRQETEQSMEQLRRNMEEKARILSESIAKLSKDMAGNFAQNKQLIVASAKSVVDEAGNLNNQMHGQWVSLDQSIAKSESTVTDKLEQMQIELSTQLQGIDASLDEIKNDLSHLKDTFDTRMNQLQMTVDQIQTTLNQEEIRKFIDDMKSLVDAWTTMMKLAADNVLESRKRFKIDDFTRLCVEHQPLHVLKWIKRNIYDTLQGHATSIPDVNFDAWQKGMLSLRNDAFIMYAACLSAKNAAAAIFDVEMKVIYEEIFGDNFLQQANSLDELNYGQWWRQNIKMLGLVSDFASSSQDQLETTLASHAHWIKSSLETQSQIQMFTIETEFNRTVSIDQLIGTIHSNRTKKNPRRSLFICCQKFMNLCQLRSNHNLLHVCMGRSVWFQAKSDQSTMVISWWRSSSGQEYSSIPDNFFIQESQSKIGFALPDMSTYSKTWNETRNAIGILSGGSGGRTKRQISVWTWTIVLTDNICWWKQGAQGDCSKNQCKWQTDTALMGLVMKVHNGVGRGKCCALCAGTENCIAVAWAQQTCLLYDKFSRVVKQNGWATASKLKDCTECTNSNTHGCSKEFVHEDATTTQSYYTSLQHLSEEDCEQRCAKAAPVCVTNGWRLTDSGSVCELNDQHGRIVSQIGSTISSDLDMRQKCTKFISSTQKLVATTHSPLEKTTTQLRMCQNVGTPRINASAGSYNCDCAPGFEGFDCATAITSLTLARPSLEMATTAAPMLCMNGGTKRSNADKNVVCDCKAGFEGHDCSIVLSSLILIVGGFNGEAESTMEIYSPSNPQLNRALPLKMRQKRYLHSSAMTDDGSVITVGGRSKDSYLSTCERYNPASKRVMPCAPLNSARESLSSSVLYGIVHVCGGRDEHNVLNTCEHYSDSKIWQYDVPMNANRSGLALVTLNGHLFAIGGNDGINILSSVEKHSSIDNQWTFAQPMNSKREGHSAVVIGNNIVVCGGFNGVNYLASCESYDPDRNQWTQIQSMHKRRSNFGFVTNGINVFAIGGDMEEHRFLSAEMYDINTFRWTLLKDPIYQRMYSSAVLFGYSNASK